MIDTLIITQPDDMHLHVRDGDMLKDVVPFSARQMARAVIMPNLKPPITTPEQALAYRSRILQAVGEHHHFTPLMTLYLTDKTTPETVLSAHQAGIVAFKLYPAGATTNSDSGVTNIFALTETLQAMCDCGMPLLVHGEVTDEHVDIFDREAFFIHKVLYPLMNRLPELRIVFEHITTLEAVKAVENGGENIGASITPQHLLLNRNDLLVGGIKPHHYCLPVLKRSTHQQALLSAIAGSYSHKFFLGTDSAPHTRQTKECACGCAGIFSASIAIELYAQAFEQAGILDKLEAFASKNASRFYRLPENTQKIRLIRQENPIPEHYSCHHHQELVPLFAGRTLNWRFDGICP